MYYFKPWIIYTSKCKWSVLSSLFLKTPHLLFHLVCLYVLISLCYFAAVDLTIIISSFTTFSSLNKVSAPSASILLECHAYQVASVVPDSVPPHGQQPTRLLHPQESPGKNNGMGCHFLPQCMKVKNESEVPQSGLTLRDPTDCTPPGSSVHGTFQARVLEWAAIAFPNRIM